MNHSLLQFCNGKTMEEIIKTLTNDPYNLKIKQGHGKYDHLFVFSYNQIKSDFKLQIVRESRGTILYQNKSDNSYGIMCRPFTKFFNLGEANAVKLDPRTTKFVSKEDGSLLKIYFDSILKEFTVASNNTIVIFDDSNINNNNSDSMYQKLEQVKHMLDFSKLDKEYTYLFELVGPTFGIVKYNDYDLYHLATIHTQDGHEISCNLDNVKQPIYVDLNSLEDAKNYVNLFSGIKLEGVIAVDDDHKRVKIKNASYVTLHHSLGSQLPPEKLCFECFKTNEIDELLATRSDLKKYMDELIKKFEKIKTIIEEEQKILEPLKSSNKKEYALAVKELKSKFNSLHFNSFENTLNSFNVVDYIRENISYEKFESFKI